MLDPRRRSRSITLMVSMILVLAACGGEESDPWTNDELMDPETAIGEVESALESDEPPMTLPIIRRVVIQNASSTVTLARWYTDAPAKCSVYYRFGGASTRSIHDTIYVNNHMMQMRREGSTYLEWIRIVCRDRYRGVRSWERSW